MQIRKESYRMSYLEGNDLSEQHMVSTPKSLRISDITISNW